jgi:ABC-type Na+ transport system ATPase subunit NatA
MTTIELSHVSRWYGNVVAINDITMTIGPGVTGLLGPNGAGKSTLLHLAAGFLAPSRGELTVAGAASWHNPGIYRTVGLVPERDSVYSFLTGEAFVRATAQLHKLPDPEAATRRAIGIVEMADAQDRRISTYSKGMRQRIKVAAALVHDPPILLLDEPFNGMDPRQRLHMMDLLHRLGDQGRTILFSSHILEEVERLSGTIQVIVAAGRLRGLPRDPAPDDQPPARVHGPHLRRPPARGLPHRPPGRDRGGADRAGAAGAGLRLRRVQPRTRGARPRPGNPAAGTAARRRVAGKRLRLPGRDLTA